MSGVVHAQYSDADLYGPWFLMFGDSSAQYMIFDGQGSVIEAGFFGLPRPAGEYTVQTDGSFSGHIAADAALPITGQIKSDSTADLFVEIESQVILFPLNMVKNAGLCQGLWTGEFKSDGQETGRQITVEIDSTGMVINGTGPAGPFDGRIYSRAGVVAGHIMTGESDAWYQIHLETGVLIDKSISGRFSLDCNDCPRGDYVLNWQPARLENRDPQTASSPVLYGNYPNPFNPSTRITWYMPLSGFMELSLYDVLGRFVRQIDRSQLPAGYHEFLLDGRNMASGIYYYRLAVKFRSGHEFSAVKKCVLVR